MQSTHTCKKVELARSSCSSDSTAANVAAFDLLLDLREAEETKSATPSTESGGAAGPTLNRHN